jgi:2,3-bisphosphoglycerate-independent phosphoglycerate mutase
VGEEADEGKFHSILTSLQHHLAKMEESKYLEPKVAGSFRELLVLTASVQANEPPPTHTQLKPPQSQQQNRSRQASVPKESLNFSTDRIAQDLKAHNIGRIRHQSPGKEDGISSRGDSNPENLFEKNVLRSASTHNPK